MADSVELSGLEALIEEKKREIEDLEAFSASQISSDSRDVLEVRISQLAREVADLKLHYDRVYFGPSRTD